MDNINNKDKIIHLLFDSPWYLGRIIESFRRIEEDIYITCDYETTFYGRHSHLSSMNGFNFKLAVAEMKNIDKYKIIHTYNIKLIDINNQVDDKKDTDSVYTGNEFSDSD